eukprot:393990-Prymnesium_polylepis.1
MRVDAAPGFDALLMLDQPLKAICWPGGLVAGDGAVCELAAARVGAEDCRPFLSGLGFLRFARRIRWV